MRVPAVSHKCGHVCTESPLSVTNVITYVQQIPRCQSQMWSRMYRLPAVSHKCGHECGHVCVESPLSVTNVVTYVPSLRCQTQMWSRMYRIPAVSHKCGHVLPCPRGKSQIQLRIYRVPAVSHKCGHVCTEFPLSVTNVVTYVQCRCSWSRIWLRTFRIPFSHTCGSMRTVSPFLGHKCG